MELLNAQGQIRLAAINYSVRHYKTGKYVKAHCVCALGEVAEIMNKLSAIPSVKNVKFVGEVER